ncbi:MAG: ATP-binding cassette domain-containing protein [Desulfurococcales archaeon]|nr:ATP-binding cassette domain-containing protein [Desulfurococcales archaeon]
MECKGRAVLEGVTVTYEGTETPAIEDAHLEVQQAEIVALVGRNGGGKTTIIRLLSGLIPEVYPAVVEGRVCVDRLNPMREDVSSVLQVVQQDVKAQVIGATGLLEAALSPIFQGYSGGEAYDAAMKALRLFGASHLAWRSTHRMSGGELQRVALAGVSSIRPKFVLLDEPTSHLDQEGRSLLIDHLKKLRDEGVGVLVATHDPGIVSVADRVYTVNRGVNTGGSLETVQPRIKRLEPDGDAVLFKDVYARYLGQRQHALKGVTLTARWSGLNVLWGPNGGGKTTVLLVAAGLLRHERGRVIVRGRVALLPQDPLLLFSKPTLAEELEYLGVKAPGWADPLMEKPVLTLSWGQLRLASLALVFSVNRDILLLDEPTSGLDPENRSTVIELLSTAASKGRAVLATGHDPLLKAAASTVYLIREGVIEACYGAC